MSHELKLELGKSYRTRGGWKATVVWDKFRGRLPMAAVHHEKDVDVVRFHREDGMVGYLPCRTADLIVPWVEKPEITDWPKWAKTAAMEKDGNWFWYDTVPLIDGCCWDCGEKHCTPFHPSEVPDWNGDWKDSLVVKEAK